MRKSILGAVLATTLLASCSKPKLIIEGEITGVKNGTTMYLETLNMLMNGTEVLDSTVVTNGVFKFERPIENIEYGFFQIKDKPGKVPVILEEGTIKAVIDGEHLEKSTVSGTYNNQEFVNHLNESTADQAKIADFMGKAQELTSKDSVPNPALQQQLAEEYKGILEEILAKDDNYIDNNPKSFLSVVLIAQKLLDPMADIEKLKAKFEKLDKSIQKTAVGKKVQLDLKRPPIPSMKVMEEKDPEDTASEIPQVGEKAPNFTAPDINGNKVSLKESLGKVTIIDFWASWCGPCRQESPNMVSLYKKYSKKGLQIVGVSLDKPGEADKWKQAITVDKLYNWVNVSNLMHWQEPIAQRYGIRSIPATYILDENGIILAKNLRGGELEDKIHELLDK